MLLGCQNVERLDKPDDLIGQDKMVSIFYDAYLANAAKSINNKKLRQMGIRLDSIIYKKHNIDSVQFARSNEYYSLDLDNYAAIFSEVEKRLLAQQVRYDSIKEVETSKNKATPNKSTNSKNPVGIDPDDLAPVGIDPVAIDSITQQKARSLINPMQSSTRDSI